MSRLRKWWVMARNPQVRFEISEPVHFGPGFGIHAPYGGTLRVGQAVEFRRGFRIELAEGYSEVSIGTGVAFTYDVVIQCGRRIEIGERCIFGQATTIVDGDHRFRRPRAADRPSRATTCGREIGDDVWAGAKTHRDRRHRRRAPWSARTRSSRATSRAYVVAVGAPAREIDYFGPPGRADGSRLGLLPGGEEVRRQLLTVVEVGAAPGARADQRGRAASRGGSGAGRARTRAAGGPRG